jgi:hypothetical protein
MVNSKLMIIILLMMKKEVIVHGVQIGKSKLYRTQFPWLINAIASDNKDSLHQVEIRRSVDQR